MAQHRDVAAFAQRAQRYDEGWLGRFHHEIADRTAALALARVPAPQRVVDVGCGPGYLLRQLAGRLPGAASLTGIDAAPEMIQVARAAAGDPRLRFAVGVAERLPLPDGCADLVVSTTSFDHWADQAAGLAECARVLAPGGWLVLTDLFSPLLLPTLTGGRRGKARTRSRAARLLAAAGFRPPAWHRVCPLLLQALTAARHS